MTQIASKVFEYTRPDSELDSDAESYEYFLVWISVDGGVSHWLFEDFQAKQEINGDVVNTKSDNITKLYKNASNSIQLIAEDITEDEFDNISKIIRALVVRRYYKDGSFDSLAIKTSEFEKPKSQFMYNFEIEVEKVESKIMR